MNKLYIVLLLLALTLSSIFLVVHSNNLKNSSNSTTFFNYRTCTNTLKAIICDDIKDQAEKSLCYSASYGVSRLTYPDGD